MTDIINDFTKHNVMAVAMLEHINDKRRQLWNVLREEYKERHGVELGLDA